MSSSSTKNATPSSAKHIHSANLPAQSLSSNNTPQVNAPHSSVSVENLTPPSFFTAINTSFFSPDFFPLKMTPEAVLNTNLDAVLSNSSPASHTSISENSDLTHQANTIHSEATTNILAKNTQNKNPIIVKKTTQNIRILKKETQKNNTQQVVKVTTSSQDTTKAKNTKNNTTKHITTSKEPTQAFIKPNNTKKITVTQKKQKQIQKAMGSFAEDYIKVHEKEEAQKNTLLHPKKALEKTLDTLKKEAEQNEIQYDTDSIILNTDIFSKLTKEIENHKEQNAYKDKLLANALETSSLTQTFQNEDGIFIPQALKSSKSKNRKKKNWQEDLQSITITSDNFTSTPLRDIDFSDVEILAQNQPTIKEYLVDEDSKAKLLSNEIILAQARVDKALAKSTKNNTIQANKVNSIGIEDTPLSDAFIDPLLEKFSPEQFSVDRLLTVKTVYATSFEDTQDEVENKNIINTSFFSLYEPIETPLEDTLMWDSVHDTFDLPYYVLKPKNTTTITENYGTLDTTTSTTENIKALQNPSETPNRTKESIHNTTQERTHKVTLDDLCVISPELVDLISYDNYFNDPICCAENRDLFEDFDTNSDWIDLTGSLGNNYTYEVLCEKQGLLICIRNEKGQFVQCLPIAYKDAHLHSNDQGLRDLILDMQEQIHRFQDSPYSILSTSIKNGKMWFTKNTNFEPYNTYDTFE